MRRSLLEYKVIKKCKIIIFLKCGQTCRQSGVSKKIKPAAKLEKFFKGDQGKK